MLAKVIREEEARTGMRKRSFSWDQQRNKCTDGSQQIAPGSEASLCDTALLPLLLLRVKVGWKEVHQNTLLLGHIRRD
jgi:hypothetical protein